MTKPPVTDSLDGVAIIGLAGRFPGAGNVDAFWENLKNGVESISHFREDQLDDADSSLLNDPRFVRSRSVLDGVDLFDAAFFGMYPKEAELTDPQHRVFLECSWEALENAGYDPHDYKGAIGVFAGCSMNTYFLSRICANPGFIEKFTNAYQVGFYPTLVGNGHDFLATRVAYKLNLRGPSFTLQAGCATSLLAVSQAYQSLLSYQSDMALAGGVSISFPQKRGYLYQEDAMVSPDGHCRTFDARAQGTVFGSGVGVVVLKRLEDAVADGDHIYAIIKGLAVNNDGSAKIGYAAPSVEGQSEVIALAHAAAGVDPQTITYVEAHGTGTPLGDPIEVAALTKAFRAGTKAKNFCALGSAKPNVGHLDVAAGITGLIKTVLSLQHQALPPLLHFERPNPKIDFADSPFYVNTKLSPWRNEHAPLRAGVSAFGVGGTNVHVILEEPAITQSSESGRLDQLLVLSAKTDSALNCATRNLAEYLKANPDANMADVAFTLQVGRRAFEHRAMLVCRDAADAISTLEAPDSRRLITQHGKPRHPAIAFMFPGQGSQYPNMGLELYQTEATFRREVDRCSEILAPHLGSDLRQLLYPEERNRAEAAQHLNQTHLAQPAIFTVEYALARTWMSWGVQPQAMIGHSVGEFVAACLAGVFSLEDALYLVSARGSLMGNLPGGTMLSVRLGERAVRDELGPDLSLAAINGPELTVVSGPTEAIQQFEEKLILRGVVSRRLHTSHAFHSQMMDPIVEPLTQILKRVILKPPSIPYVSCLTGRWITPSEAVTPSYWARHCRESVRFSDAIGQLSASDILLEVGPGTALATLARQSKAKAQQCVVSSLSSASSPADESSSLLHALGRLWLSGVAPQWSAVHGEERRQRVPLPTYPFERKRYWLETEIGADSKGSPVSTEQHSAANDARNGSVRLNSGSSNGHANTNTNRSNDDDDPHAAAGPIVEPSLEESASQMKSPITAVGNRQERILPVLSSIFEDLSGMNATEIFASAAFLELGFDSLLLTQVAQAVQSKFGIKITFRQLLDQESTLAALAAYLDAKLPESDFAEEPAVPGIASAYVVASPSQVVTAPPPTVSFAGSNGNSSGAHRADIGEAMGSSTGSITAGSIIERILREQLRTMSELMSSQLEALTKNGVASHVESPVMIHGETIDGKTTDGRAIDGQTANGETNRAGVLREPVPVVLPKEAGSEVAAPKGKEGKQDFKAFGPYKPVQQGPKGGLTARQQKHLDALIVRYNERTKESKRLTQTHRPRLADPRVAAGFRSQWKDIVYPIVTTRSSGSKLWDVDGNEYIDILNGYGPTMFGHAPKFVTDAVAEQLKLGFEIGPQSPLAGKVAALICEFTGMERATFCNTGSEAVMAALRLSRTVTGRKKVVLFAGAYHGTFDEVLVKGIKKAGAPHSLPIAPGIPPEKVANVTVLDYGTPESLAFIRDHAHELAAVLVEPVQSRHPALQPKEFLQEVRKITIQSGTALIFDEVVTGFRSHPGGVQAIFGIRADLATYGKVLAGGLPIGVLAGCAKFMDALDGGTWSYGDDSFPEVGVTFFAGTFVRHPLALAACWAVLNHLKDSGPELQQRLTQRTADLVRILNEFCERRHVPTRIESFASIFYFSFPSDLRFGSLFYYHMREKGIHIQEGFPCFLTTAHSDEDVQRIIQVFKECMVEMQSGEFLPAPAAALLDESLSAALDLAVSAGAEGISEAPLTEAQLEVWLSAQLGDEASCSYNESVSLHLRGQLREAALRESLQGIIDRHQALRTTFSADGHSSHFSPSLTLSIKWLDLSSQGREAAESELQNWLAEDARTAFDLTMGPLVRASLVKLAEEHHVLVLTTHHIICDGWSVNVILDELGKLYSEKAGLSPGELPVPLQFGEYARKRAQHLGSAEMISVEEYWRQQFSTLPPVLELPTDRPRHALRTYHGATYRCLIDAEPYRGIKRAGAQRGCTLFVTLLAGLHALLHRLTAQEDLVVGIPTAGQSLLDGATLVGHCVNFLPIRQSFSGSTTAVDLLKQVKHALLDAYEHQDYTFGTLVRRLAIPRNPSRLPLIEVQFNLEQVGGKMSFAGLSTTVDSNPKCFVNFDLFLNVRESAEGLVLDCDYNTDILDEATIDRWMACYRELLKGVVADPTRSIATLPLLPADQFSHVIYERNDTAQEYPEEKCVHQLFEEQVARTPVATAVVFEGRRVTYAELNRKANQLANHLRTLGVGPGCLVGLFVERSLEMMIGLWGILKSGAAYVPMDPTYPKERIKFIFNETRMSVLLTLEGLARDVELKDARVLCLDTNWCDISKEDASEPPQNVTSQDLAYVIYTSGSTGEPKGVEITHRSVANLLWSMKREPGLDDRDILLAVTTLSFDIAGLELCLPLCVGARLVIASREAAADGSQLLAILRSSEITVMQATPVTWRLLLEAGWKGSPRLKILCGGEALPRDLANQLLETGAPLWNMYGPTETTIWSATSLVQPGEGPVPIGPPIANTQFYVLDALAQPVPVGVSGELYIGGDGLARGYFNRADLTAQKFIQSSLHGGASTRIYKTGDLVRWLYDGTLEFLGRSDQQVKLRGFRVELGEIESALLHHSSLREAVVMAREDVPGDKRLVAYVVANPGHAPDSTGLKSFLLLKLPDYMVPSLFTIMPSMPLTPNGKVDRKALPAPDWKNLRPTKKFVAPVLPGEEALARIWAEVLRLDRVSIEDNIFELGADSLHVFQIAARANKAGLTVTPRMILQHRTIAAIAVEMAAAGKNGNGAKPTVRTIEPVSRDRFRIKVHHQGA